MSWTKGLGRLPGIATARGYHREWLRTDITAGLVLTALLIPAGMGYAEAAGLPAYAGLYATIVPLLAYALVGPSKILVLGPDSSLAPLIAAAILPLAIVGDEDNALALAGVLAILVGLILLIGGFLRLGFVTELLSKPIRLGYLNAIALVVVIGQIPKLLGFSVDASGLLGEIGEIGKSVAGGDIDPVAAAVGIGSLAVIVAFRLWVPVVPGVLVAVVGAIILSAAAGLTDDIGMVGALPEGLPLPSVGGVSWQDVGHLIGPAAGIALIAFADTGVLSRTFAARHGEDVNGSTEMKAIGVANVAGGLFGGFPISASGSRTPVAEQSGAHTQLAGVVGALAVLVFVLVAPGLTAYLPDATLAAVVIVAACALIDVGGMVRMWRMSTVEFGLAVAAFLGVALVGVLQGILVAIGLSFVAVVAQVWQPHRTELVEIAHLQGFHDVERHPDGQRIPGLVLVRFDAPLFFANGEIFDEYVRSVVADAPAPVEWVVIAAEPITGLDTTAVDELVDLDTYLEGKGIRLAFAEMKGPIKDKLIRFGVGDRFDATHFFPTIEAAVNEFRSRSGNSNHSTDH
ncbi:sodium-independent anion transporter [Rhodococcus sp. ACPA4]|uniref:SulP family inorganic anion transporter n=1 Tax=unclassified Rhodococcus (in: high G+C Gram-positive bacteria) TaxID=192944 RepID=UPI0005D41E43|nr:MULTISPECIES: SulP family inorganic anion transporter [unclassified Rhodococcus (in: high G+C Gram-positive bacteria)]KJF22551.1 putative sulfate transporter [Rhodococcus sp. AD45]MDV8068419.1 SulP family inorganic anion transporter [Rhodococcus sp. IEGM 1366]NRI64355.1 STAS domain-containing protein [Rhodococcus sp. MS16]PBC40928.1 sodium-independent anion transporter [Rhodococcus sp. ACPA4]PSR40157.1 STAS domain-containing protein [Rhodococcus sp. AD45-ID]